MEAIHAGKGGQEESCRLYMDLFSHAGKENREGQPLAEQLRPRRLDEMLGQTKILGGQAAWRRLLDSGKIPSLILWGPPGTGKTTFALLLAQKVSAEFITVNAVEVGAKALREIGDEGRRRRLEQRRQTLLFVDEIHRLNKGQQDVLLPFLEKGDLILVGATTENPSYEINAALLSRCRVLVFERLGGQELCELAKRAAQAKGCALVDILADDGLESVVEYADGDGRRLLNLMELIGNLYLETRNGNQDAKDDRPIDQEPPTEAELVWPMGAQEVARFLDAPFLRYDKSADEHYDTISAFIKSVRGSDPDAAVYYLARMLKGGEDPVFISRRLVILASEDIGNADPRALTVAISALQAVEAIGLPESAITLAQATTYLASAPKSNRSYMALKKAQELVEETGTVPIPLALRSAKGALMRGLGYGKDYKYSHDGAKGYLPQRFLPEELGDVQIYEPTDHGFEKNIRQYLAWLRS